MCCSFYPTFLWNYNLFSLEGVHLGKKYRIASDPLNKCTLSLQIPCCSVWSSRNSSAQLVWLWLCKSGVFCEAAATLCTVSKRLLLMCLSAWIYNQSQIWCYVHLLNLLCGASRLLTCCLRAKLLFVHAFACHFVDIWMKNSVSKSCLASWMVKCLAWVKFLSSGCPTSMFLFQKNATYLVTDDKRPCKTLVIIHW